jgi:regulatory protein
MGTITAIKPQKRPGRYNVLVDDTFAIAISEKVLLDLALTVGKELGHEQIAEAAKADDFDKAFTSALRLLDVRPRSEREIRNRLTQRNYDESIISDIVAKLRKHDFIDDAEFATVWVESRSRSRPGGVRKLRSELIQKGIARETIDSVVGSISESDEIELAQKALSSRKAAIPTSRDERQAAYIRDAGYLSRRGFNWSIVKHVLHGRYGTVDERIDD